MLKKLKKVRKKVLGIISSFRTAFDPKLQAYLSKSELRRISRLRPKHESFTRLLSRKVSFPDGYWFIHSMNELFVEEVYKFISPKDNPYIIDCGANIGLSIIYFKQLYPFSRILAFEPDENIFKKLNDNIAQFNYKDVELINQGVWKERTTLSFLAEGTLGGKVVEGDSVAPSKLEIISIRTLRLRDYLTGSVDFLKLDIEGAEYEVLVDCAELLQNVHLLFVEYHSTPGKAQKLNEILEIISKAGFRYYIKEASHEVNFPFIESSQQTWFDLQLNIFCYRC